MTPNTEELHSLIHTIAELSTEVSSLRGEVATENKTRKDSIFRLKILAAVASVVGVIGLLVGGVGVYQAREAHLAATQAQSVADAVQQQQDQILATRNESRKTQCAESNNFISYHNKLVDNVEAGVRLISQPASSTQRTPEEQAAVDKFVADYVSLTEQSRLVPRDCSPEGIATYYGD